MSLLKTKPSWAPNAVATQMGWQDPVTKEVYVSVPRLLTRLEEEERIRVVKSVEVASVAPVEDVVKVELQETSQDDVVAPVETPVEEVKEEVVIIETKPEVIAPIEQPKKKAGRPKKVLGEVVEQPQSVQVIGEVVEYPDVQVIGE